MTLSITAYDLESSETVTVPSVAELTSGSINGTGIFDILMQAVKVHLKEEYGLQRITGKDYATVYLGALTAVLQQAVQYAVSYRQTERLAAEIGLIRQQTVTELAKTDNAIPLGLGFNDSTEIEGLTAAEIARLEAEGKLTEQKTQTELAQTSGYVIPGYGLTKPEQTDLDGLLQAQINLLLQKTVTETGQVDDAAAPGGIIQRQRDLYSAQTEGFFRDAEQKAAKMMIDTWSVRRTTDDGLTSGDAGLGDSAIEAVVLKMRAGINA